MSFVTSFDQTIIQLSWSFTSSCHQTTTHGHLHQAATRPPHMVIYIRLSSDHHTWSFTSGCHQTTTHGHLHQVAITPSHCHALQERKKKRIQTQNCSRACLMTTATMRTRTKGLQQLPLATQRRQPGRPTARTQPSQSAAGRR